MDLERMIKNSRTKRRWKKQPSELLKGVERGFKDWGLPLLKQEPNSSNVNREGGSIQIDHEG